jgi:hypothetical protein
MRRGVGIVEGMYKENIVEMELRGRCNRFSIEE